MVKPSSSSSSSSSKSDRRRDDSCSSVYRGVRKRKWGKYVSEIRLPNSRERIWLGSYDTPEKAARAFDAALFCLRGKSAKFNFPNNPPDMEGCESLTPLQIQSLAAKFAHDHDHNHIIKTDIVKYISRSPSDISSSGYSYSSSSSTSTPSSTAAITDGLVPIHDHDINKNLSMDWSFLDFLSAVPESVNSTINYESADFGDFTAGMDDFSIDFFPPLPDADYVEDNGCTEVIFPYHHHNQQSFLWNF